MVFSKVIKALTSKKDGFYVQTYKKLFFGHKRGYF